MKIEFVKVDCSGVEDFIISEEVLDIENQVDVDLVWKSVV